MRVTGPDTRLVQVACLGVCSVEKAGRDLASNLKRGEVLACVAKKLLIGLDSVDTTALPSVVLGM